ncbi:MAG: hypothetical protein K8R59_03280 [Thermoanaerobaculales bacterium]|nr:hypothetical protein [Thermoanaerobaculales bacterium]
MNRRYSILFAVVVLLLSTGPALAQEVHKTYSVSIEALPAPVRISAPAVVESFGFEVAEGFAPGYIAGQVGWTAFSASLVEGHIDTANPATGTQHLRIANDPAVGAGSNTGAFSPEVADAVVDASYVEVDVAISATGGADYDVVPQTPTQGLLTAQVKFYYLGDIQVLDDTGSGLAFIDTGTDWNVGPYTTLGIYVDPVANTIDYYYGGSLIYTSVAGVFGGTIIEQVVLFSDNYHAGEVGDFDNLVIERGEVPVELVSFDVK